MNIGLGIDTGGTYTDAVIYDFDTDKPITWTKALTTKEQLTIGIDEALSHLPQQLLKEIKLVSLSTTLATNACVENKGGRAMLILMGYDEDILKRYGPKYGLPPVNEMILIPGRHDQQGQSAVEPAWDELHRKIEHCKDKVDVFGIAEYWGVRNPEYEQQAKDYIAQWTGLPTVCAHELSDEINSLRRAASTLLNARLIPLITELLKAVKHSLRRAGINAPLMIVRGDGTLMTEEFAMYKPVETLLSGPAASVMGGMKLSDIKDCLIVDMGGTTSDLAVVRDGRVIVAQEGVNVGGWRTGTRAIRIDTVGLGGDSLLSFDADIKLTVGPRKATPLAWLAYKYPQIKEELKRIKQQKQSYRLSLAEFFYIQRMPDYNIDYTEEEQKILDSLSDGPLSLEQLGSILNCRPFMLPVQRLEQLGIIMRSGLTPTDMTHITGQYDPWDKEAAQLGAEILAGQLGMTVEQLNRSMHYAIEKQLYDLITRILLEYDWKQPLPELPKIVQRLLDMSFDHPAGCIECALNTSLPLIGIGAPIHLFLPSVAKHLGTSCIISADAPVANAIGAITGSIMVEQTVLIRPIYDTSGIIGYSCHSSEQHAEFKEYGSALQWAQDEALRIARLEARARGAADMNISLEQEEETAQAGGEERETLLLGIKISARGISKIGNPQGT